MRNECTSRTTLKLNVHRLAKIMNITNPPKNKPNDPPIVPYNSVLETASKNCGKLKRYI